MLKLKQNVVAVVSMILLSASAFAAGSESLSNTNSAAPAAVAPVSSTSIEVAKLIGTETFWSVNCDPEKKLVYGSYNGTRMPDYIGIDAVRTSIKDFVITDHKKVEITGTVVGLKCERDGTDGKYRWRTVSLRGNASATVSIGSGWFTSSKTEWVDDFTFKLAENQTVDEFFSFREARKIENYENIERTRVTLLVTILGDRKDGPGFAKDASGNPIHGPMRDFFYSIEDEQGEAIAHRLEN